MSSHEHKKDHPEKHPKPPAEKAGAVPLAPSAPELLAAKTRQCQDLVDHLQRLAAEYSNYQKRTAQRIEEERRRAIRDLVLDLLPAADNFERALAAAQKNPDFQALLDGVRLVHEQFLAALQKHGITPIEAEGRPFDPEHHEAVAAMPSAEHPEGQVIEEMQKGYRLHDQTIRASRVAVSGGQGDSEREEKEPPAGDEPDAGEPPDEQAKD